MPRGSASGEVPSTPMKRDVFQRGLLEVRMVSCVVVGCHVLFFFSRQSVEGYVYKVFFLDVFLGHVV